MSLAVKTIRSAIGVAMPFQADQCAALTSLSIPAQTFLCMCASMPVCAHVCVCVLVRIAILSRH